jgi:hypothetical protein
MAAAAAVSTGDWKAVQFALQDITREYDELYGLVKKAPVYKFKIDDETKNFIQVQIRGTEKFVEMTKEAYKQYKKLQDTAREPIGRGKKKTTIVDEVEMPPTAEAMAKSEFKKLQAIIDREMALLDTRYELGVEQVRGYFDQRQALVKQSIEAEIAELQRAAEKSDDPDVRLAIQTKIFEKRQELEIAMLELTAKRIQEEEKLEKEKLKKQEQMVASRLAIEKIFNQQKRRLDELSSNQLSDQFERELDDLKDKHDREIALLQENNATKAEINDLHRMQELEKERVAENQWKRMMKARLEIASETTGSMASLFSEMYELSGKKNKEFFIASKAASIAQATVNTAVAVTKALSEGGPYSGPILAAIAAASGAVQIAKIASTSYAEGGEVKGHSPHKKADNIRANLTAGEYVEPVSAVDYYGAGVFEAMRKKQIPKSLFAGFRMPGVPQMRTTRFAAGGQVAQGPAREAGESGSGENININNFIDPALFSQHMQSTSGERDVMNVLTKNQFKLKQMVLSE